MAELAGRIAVELGLSESVAVRCRLGGWLHDIGKLAIPDRVLQESRTSDEARAGMHKHVEHGADIVSRLWALGGAYAAVRHHHERYDGTGYPDALAGDEIPIDARIVAAADAFSAITERPALPARARAGPGPRAAAGQRRAQPRSRRRRRARRRGHGDARPHIRPARSSDSGGASFRSCVTVTAR